MGHASAAAKPSPACWTRAVPAGDQAAHCSVPLSLLSATIYYVWHRIILCEHVTLCFKLHTFCTHVLVIILINICLITLSTLLALTCKM